HRRRFPELGVRSRCCSRGKGQMSWWFISTNTRTRRSPGMRSRRKNSAACSSPVTLPIRKFCLDAVKQTVKSFGRLDILVNNSAFQLHVPRFDDLTEDYFDKRLKTNFYGYFYMAQAAVPHMKTGSAILNTGSVTGIKGNKDLLDYSM